MIYDTKNFELVRIFSIVSTTYTYLEFSRDNYSQLIAVSAEGYVKSFLVKGKITVDDLDSSPYFDAKAMSEDKPLELIPYYDVTSSHLLSADTPN